jgi:hypothetical protein
VGIVVFLVAVLLRLPASLVTERLPENVAVAQSSGTLWRGELRGLRVDGQSLGTLRYRLHLLALFSGKAAADVTIDGPGLSGSGFVAAGDEAVELRGFEGTAALGTLGLTDFFDAPLKGSASFDVERLRFGRDGCERAELTAVTDALQQSLGGIAGGDLVLRGTGQCEGETLVLPMQARGEQGEVDVRLAIGPDGQWRSGMDVRPQDPRLGGVLEQSGFERTEAGWSVVRAGQWEELL